MAQSTIFVLMSPILNVGKVKSIGVSNFSIKTLNVLLPQCTVVPVTNQVEMHPCLPQHELKQYCESKGIILTAYSPLGPELAVRCRISFDDNLFTQVSHLGPTRRSVYSISTRLKPLPISSMSTQHKFSLVGVFKGRPLSYPRQKTRRAWQAT